ncbi:Uu.00g031020.m01.CDS01 [Anthostomella pinea]|uniref:Uu.00g031020.m01.CDS01 n=1 Tax=Anthostomella pinea TaxID=933095 RepID=A0AAI8YAM5_9PEZI|nr:Uu.00g031020.m01.CDS01 [Anthostomella pinea]
MATLRVGADLFLGAPNKKQVNEIRNHFNALPDFAFEEIIGRGAYGLTFRVVEKLANGKTRRLAVKRALSKESESDLRREITWMTRLGGAAHIARVLGTRNVTGGNMTNTRRGLAQLFRTRSRFLIGIEGPVLALEYLENGSLAGMYKRMCRAKTVLPNRILWSFWVCLVRACIAMAYPPDRGINATPRLEQITAGAIPGTLEHGDLHRGNIMIGLTDDFGEHGPIPGLKLIDFGTAQTDVNTHTRATPGTSWNIREMSNMMLDIIAHRTVLIETNNPVTYKGYETGASEILDVPGGGGANYPTLDEDFRDLMARCLARDQNLRPSLPAILTESLARAGKGAASYGANQALETDEAIRDVLKNLIYDASTTLPSDPIEIGWVLV